MKCPEPGCGAKLRVRRSNCSTPGEHRRIRDCPKCGFSARSEEILTTGSPAVINDAIRAGILYDLITEPRTPLRDVAARWNTKLATVRRYKRHLVDARRVMQYDMQHDPAKVLNEGEGVVIMTRTRKPRATVFDPTNAAPAE